jgi:hypothetical protein
VWGPSTHVPEAISGSGVLALADDGPATSQQRGGSNTSCAPQQPLVLWPADTDIILVPGTTRMRLTAQRPLIRCILQDSFEHIRMSLMFRNAFPDVFAIPVLIQESLTMAAESRLPKANDILRRLQSDEEYMDIMMPLVSYIMSNGTSLTILRHAHVSLSFERRSEIDAVKALMLTSNRLVRAQ